MVARERAVCRRQRAGLAAAPHLRQHRAMSFREILQALVEVHAPAVRGSIFCDEEGERVDAASHDIDPWDLDVLGASWAPALQALPPGTRLRARLGGELHHVWLIQSGYFVVVVCRDDATVRAALPAFIDALAAHM
jgi:hypothetical protein